MNSHDPDHKLEPTRDLFPQEFRCVDPRSGKNFAPNLYPQADETAAPSQPRDRNERITLEFCAVYYELNRLYAKLMETRSQADSPKRSVRERAVMQEIEKYLRVRDELEDRYAPYGVIAEAITQAGLTVNIKFTFGDREVAGQRQMQFVSSSALLIFPKPRPSVSNTNDQNRESQT
jgi:hypothetical protein